MRGHKQGEDEYLSVFDDKLQPGDEAIMHLSLEGILPPGHILAAHSLLGILAHLARASERPRLLSVQRFSATEMCLLLPLLQ
jgi:hypothetical protein